MDIPNIPPVDAPAAAPAAQPAPQHTGCPFFNNGKCMVLNEDVRDLGKQGTAEYDDSEEADLTEL